MPVLILLTFGLTVMLSVFFLVAVRRNRIQFFVGDILYLTFSIGTLAGTCARMTFRSVKGSLEDKVSITAIWIFLIALPLVLGFNIGLSWSNRLDERRMFHRWFYMVQGLFVILGFVGAIVGVTSLYLIIRAWVDQLMGAQRNFIIDAEMIKGTVACILIALLGIPGVLTERKCRARQYDSPHVQ